MALSLLEDSDKGRFIIDRNKSVRGEGFRPHRKPNSAARFGGKDSIAADHAATS
jgi:hypothetical protein